MITGVVGVSDGVSVRCYSIGIGEMEMYRMMDSFTPRNFLQSRSPRCRSDQLEVPRLEQGRAAFFFHLPKNLHCRPSQYKLTSLYTATAGRHPAQMLTGEGSMSQSPDQPEQERTEETSSGLTASCIGSTGSAFSEDPIDHSSSSRQDVLCKYKNNFFKEAQFSPDGTTIVTHNDDGCLRTFVLPQDLLDASKHPHHLAPYSTLQSPTNVQSYALYPGFSLQDLSTTLVLSAPVDQPLRLTNAMDPSFTHATYPYIHSKTEAYISPNSLTFHPDGNHFVAGSHGAIAIFDTARTGEGPIAMHITKPKDPKMAATSMRDGSLIMSVDISSDGVLAAGSSNRTVGIFSSSGHGSCQTAFSVAPACGDTDASTYSGTGITSLAWTPESTYLLVGERQSDGIHVYDVRNKLRRVAWLAGRKALTPQRLGFSTVPTQSGLEVWAGGVDGVVRMWHNPGQLEGVQQPNAELEGMHDDPVTSTVWHPGVAVMASCSGQRWFHDEDESTALHDNSLKVWTV
jgi:WD40 repeat protein